MQLARYVEGRDTCLIEEVARVAGEVMATQEEYFHDGAFGERLRNDAELEHRTAARIATAQAEMRSLPTAGVPQLLVVVEDRRHVLNGEVLYQDPQTLLDAVAQL